MKLLPTLLAALAHTGAKRLRTIARRISPTLPDDVYVTEDRWCYLPNHGHLVLERGEYPEIVRSFHRFAFVSLAVVEQPDGNTDALLLNNGKESLYVMFGRDPQGYVYEKETSGPREIETDPSRWN